MPRPLLICLFLCLTIRNAWAQDTTIVLTNERFASKDLKPVDNVNLSYLGWVYKPGHNPAWASTKLNTLDWTKRAPLTFSAQDADASGKAEGWFRRRLRIDSTFNLLPLGLASEGRAASEVYINGKLVAVFGSTGTRGKPYAEYNSYLIPPQPVQLEAGKDYLIAIHLVDYVFPLLPFGPKKLKSEVFNNIHNILLLCRPQLMADRYIKAAKLNAGFLILWLTVSLLLALLFWVLSSQQLPEKNTIRLWAIVETLFVIDTLCYCVDLVHTSFIFICIAYVIPILFQWPILSLGMVAFLQLFGYSISSKWVKISGVVSLGLGIVTSYVDPRQILFAVCCLGVQLLLIYIIIISWKRLKGAQWAIVGGTGLGVLFAAFIGIVVLTKTSDRVYTNVLIRYLLQSGLLLSLPLSFLVYLVLRFKETLADVRIKAEAVVLVTEEKRALLADQNERLEQQVIARTAELQASQQQLIQKEKLASLGELTAGIAHEIQNPLNFVNNFSEVSAELIEELKEEVQAGHTEDVLAIAEDLTNNLLKIHHHGGRASSIVKGMLEHSRTESGEIRLTDLNALADEYLKIAYHGLRAKDKNFNCELITDFDSTLDLIEVAPQEIGRVLLNLYNNAFYAVSEQAKKPTHSDYKPTVEVRTIRQLDRIELRVRDNGAGIPESIRAKIFQPFFTTKPTGEGTGLGLSLSYDIVTKGHGGTLSVESTQNEGSAFTILLPKSIYE